MSFSCGIKALYALVRASLHARALFRKRPHAFFTGAIRCSSMDLQCQTMLCSLISIRQFREQNAAGEDLGDFVHQTLTDQSTRTHRGPSCTPPTGSMELLAYVAELCDFVTVKERSLIGYQLPQFAVSGQSVVARDRFLGGVQDPFTLEYRIQHPAATELHRIRRALWRVCLYFEAFYVPHLPPVYSMHDDVILSEANAVKKPTRRTEMSPKCHATPDANTKFIESQKCFFLPMTVRELEEMDCVWNHLHESSQFWQRSCPHCWRSLLPDDLIGHLRECSYEMDDGSRRSGFGGSFRDACDRFRGDLDEYGIPGRNIALATVAWLISLAR